MKILKKIALILLSLVGVIVVILGLIIGYLYAFKLSNSSDLTPHKNVEWQLSIYPKNGISTILDGLSTGENLSEIRAALAQLDSMRGEDYTELKGIEIGKPFHFFGDHIDNNELQGEIYAVSNLSDFKSTYIIKDQNFVFIPQGKSVCVIKSKTLSTDQLTAYFKKNTWSKSEFKGKDLMSFRVHTIGGERLAGTIKEAGNSINLSFDIELKESYQYDNVKGTYGVNFAEDKSGKQNPILKMMSTSIDYLYHDYKGVSIDLVDGQPVLAPVGPTILKSSKIDSTWYAYKHPNLQNCTPTKPNIICWSEDNNTKALKSTPLYIKLKGVDLLQIEGNPMITAVLSMSTVIGDFMQIIANMDEIEVQSKMISGQKMNVTVQIKYDSDYHLLGDLLLYTIKNQEKFKEVEKLVNPESN